MANGNPSDKTSAVRRGTKAYTTPTVRTYGNIQDITLASSNRLLQKLDASATRPAKTA